MKTNPCEQVFEKLLNAREVGKHNHDFTWLV
jgi:hypothetical protein